MKWWHCTLAAALGFGGGFLFARSRFRPKALLGLPSAAHSQLSTLLNTIMRTQPASTAPYPSLEFPHALAIAEHQHLPKTKLAIMTNSRLPDDEFWPGTHYSVRAFVQRAWRAAPFNPGVAWTDFAPGELPAESGQSFW